jgi:Uncharacterised nucleotidyltransferase
MGAQGGTADASPPSSAIWTAALSLRVDNVTAEVVTAMREAGIRTVLLKGPSIASWLYRDRASRPYVDSDLLVAPWSYRQAGSVLRELGFRPYGYSWHSDSESWRRHLDSAIVDLHRSLIGISASPNTVWEELVTDTDTLPVGGIDVEVLRVPARALHVALHAAEHGDDLWHPLEDLVRALRVADEDVWQQAADLARRIDAVPAFAAGLRFNPAGARLAARLQLPGERPPAVAVRAGPDVPIAIALGNLTSEQRLRTRARLLLRALFPSPRYIRNWSTARMSAWPAPLRRGAFGLVLAYVWRPIWILLHLPKAIRAVRGIRREGA